MELHSIGLNTNASFLTTLLTLCLALAACGPSDYRGGGGGGNDEVASLQVNNDTAWTPGDLLACVDGTFDDTSSVENATDNGQCVYVNVPSPGELVLFELGTSAGLAGWDAGEDLKLHITWPAPGGGWTCARFTMWELDIAQAYLLSLSAVPTPEQAITDNSGTCQQFIEGSGSGELCTDTCGPEGKPGGWAGDGACDDGGEGSEFDVCDFGTDCTDCGPR